MIPLNKLSIFKILGAYEIFTPVLLMCKRVRRRKCTFHFSEDSKTIDDPACTFYISLYTEVNIFTAVLLLMCKRVRRRKCREEGSPYSEPCTTLLLLL